MRRFFSEDGLSMIEIAMATFVLFFALSILITMIAGAAKSIASSRALDQATFLANEKMEYLRSLPYGDVGYLAPVGAEPGGVLPRTETKNVSGNVFTVAYDISWVDDPKDGTGGADADSEPNDYKRAIIKVTWTKPSVAEYVIASNISGRQVIGLPPVVEFVWPTPDSNTIVSGPISISIHGTQNSTSSAVAFIGLEIGGGILNFGNSYTPAVADATHAFLWDTAMVDATTGARITSDGIYEARGIARDTVGLESYISYFYTVNNNLPGQVTTATVFTAGTTVTVTTANTTGYAGSPSAYLNWGQVYDGRELVGTYRIYRNASLITSATGSSYNDTGLTGWSLYDYEITALSHGDESTRTAFTPTPVRICFGVDGYLRKSGSSYYCRLGWKAPPPSVIVDHYHIWKSVNGGLFVDYATTTGLGWEGPLAMGSGLTWTYYVVAHDAANNVLNYSNPIEFKR